MRTLGTLFSLVLFSTALLGQTPDHVVISEVYGGGGNSGATYKNDFIELYNPTASAVDLSGWSVQYASGTGSTWQVTILSGTIAPSGFYLVEEGQGSGGTVDLPSPDNEGRITMSASSGKVALVRDTVSLTGSSPLPSSYVDLLGYGSANGYEGTGPAPSLSNTESAERKAQSASTAASMASGGEDAAFGNGCDTDDNTVDFVAQSYVDPQNSSSPTEKLSDKSLPVMMRGASAKVAGGKVILTFSTASEVDIAGFDILRAPAKEGPYEIVSGYTSNPALRAAGENNSGAIYSFTDLKVIPGETYCYKIESVNRSATSRQTCEILAVTVGMPETFEVFQNFPNPFNPATTIAYSIPSSVHGYVTLKVYDVTGREIAVLVDGKQSEGIHSVEFDGGKFSSGIYFYKLEIASGENERHTAIKKMILIK